MRAFLLTEILVGLVGGVSPLLLFFAYAVLHSYLPWLIGFSLLVGARVGLEIPLLVRILRGQAGLRAALGNVLSLDYLGALAASLLFPLLLVPYLGLVRTGFVFGLLNVAVGLIGLQLFRAPGGPGRRPALGRLLAAAALLAGAITAGRTTRLLEDALYDDPIIYARSTPYQRIVITRWRDDLRLFIDGNIQFSSADEFRYHEALVHPAMSLVECPRRVLVLGGGDGLAVREVLKYGCVQRVDLVDLDPEMTRIFSRLPVLLELNQRALLDPRVHIHNEDAQKFLEADRSRFEVILIDLPDPNNEGLGRLYARSFYKLVRAHLGRAAWPSPRRPAPSTRRAPSGASSNTIADAWPAGAPPALKVLPYHASVPSFGEWGFVLASLRPLEPRQMRLRVPTRYLTQELLPSLFIFPADMQPRPTPINRLDNQVLVRLYDHDYRRFNR